MSKSKSKILGLIITVAVFHSSVVFGGDLTILTENSPPGNFLDSSGGLKGIGVDIVKGIIARLDRPAPIRVLPWARAYRMLLNTPDVMLFSTTRTAQREHLFKWVGPLFEAAWIFLAKKEGRMAISSLADAKHVRLIGTYREDARRAYLQARGFTNLYVGTDMAQLVRMLDKDRLDLVAISKVGQNPCCGLSKRQWNRYKSVYTFSKVGLYMAFSKETDDQVVRQWQQAYDDLNREGFIEAVHEKWLK